MQVNHARRIMRYDGQALRSAGSSPECVGKQSITKLLYVKSSQARAGDLSETANEAAP